jgi:hypothetical protein
VGRGLGGIAGVVNLKVFFTVPFSEITEATAVYFVFFFNPLNATFVESAVSMPVKVLALEEEDLRVIE